MKKSWISIVIIVIIALLIFRNTNDAFSLSNRKEHMLDLGYEVETFSADKIAEVIKISEESTGIKLTFEINTAIGCLKDSKNEMIIALWFDEEDFAQEFKKNFDLIGESVVKEIIGASGKYGVKDGIFYVGTLQACEDFLSR